MISISTIASIYVQLVDEIHSRFLEGERHNFPRGAKKLAGMMGGYCSQQYELVKFDFNDLSDAPEHVQRKVPDRQDMFSICMIRERPKSNGQIQIPLRKVVIFLNTGVNTKTGNPMLNRCWGRYCLTKEVFQAALYEDMFEDAVGEYPVTTTFDEMTTLYSQINNEPFSLWDFGDEQYGNGLAVENAAEFLAAGILFPFEHALELQQRLKGKYGSSFSAFNFFSVANYYKLPERYVELLVTWSALEGFVGDIKRARDGVLTFRAGV